jgi:Lumazine binding domain/3,4-dihydroxy-2-butanone 4-phosphate synthase
VPCGCGSGHRRFLDEIVAKGSVAVDGVSLTVAEVLADRFSVALIPVTLAETTLAGLRPEQRVSLESDLFVKSARDLWQSARQVASRSLAALPWAGELTGQAGVDKCAAHLAAGGGVLIYDADREAEADVVFAGARLQPESKAFLLTQVCGHTTVPCDRMRLDRRTIGPRPSAVLRTRTPRPPTSCAPVMSSRWPDAPAALPSEPVTPRRHWRSARPPACPRWRPSARSWGRTATC